jgi:peptide/nickel transport system substrate-binding protein
VETELKASAVLIALLTALAHAETRPHYGGAIDATLLGAPSTVDPVLARSHADVTLVELVFDTLYRVGADGLAVPHLASALPTVDKAGTTARIALRRGVAFHDRTELGAADVAASLERARVQAPWLVAPIAGVRVDGDAIEVALKAPVGDLAALLALPQTAITKGGRAPGKPPIGSGPFVVVDAIDFAKRRVALRAFDDHFAGRPYLDRLVLHWYAYDDRGAEQRAFESDGAQVSARGVAAFVGAQPKYRADDVEGPTALLAFVGFGGAHPKVTDQPAFRRAVDLALARRGLTDVTSGERVVPTREPVPVEAGGTALPASQLDADVAAAKAALADGAKRERQLEKIPQLELLFDETRPDDRLLGERVANALFDVGVTVKLTAVAAAALRERVAARTCDLWIGQLVAPVTARATWWAAAFAAGNDASLVPQLATGALDANAARAAFAAKLPIVPLMFRSLRLWHRTDVRGLHFDASGRPAYADVFLFGQPVRGGK